MKRSYIGLALGALVAVGAVLSLPSCAHDQKVVSLTITPQPLLLRPRVSLRPLQSTQQYVATATYIHPPPPRTSLVRRPGPLITTWPRCRLPASSMRRLRRQPLH